MSINLSNVDVIQSNIGIIDNFKNCAIGTSDCSEYDYILYKDESCYYVYEEDITFKNEKKKKNEKRKRF